MLNPMHRRQAGRLARCRPGRRAAALAILTALLLPTAASAQLGPPGGTIYAHDVAYRTIATPKNLPPHGRFDAIYVLGDDLAAVAEAAPGDRDYNGGRWEVRLVTFETIPPTQFTNVEDLRAAEARGEVSFSDVVRRFVCPMIRK
jgi:hypothetical protein